MLKNKSTRKETGKITPKNYLLTLVGHVFIHDLRRQGNVVPRKLCGKLRAGWDFLGAHLDGALEGEAEGEEWSAGDKAACMLACRKDNLDEKKVTIILV